ncbi:MFS transporter [Thermus thermophilus]|uniref:Probable nitrate/nitrite antiporter NarK1 n=2 Tax=Thermus thermophilus TaxID=274 RepID=NARK1_THETH|nr:nitrate/nitrite transporter [Thermus thermophilus]Q9RA46.2 RecName: Full=Probable nitrate/nitrite antiporter NarK1 [Thermus thermophilus]CAB65479.2 Nitrate/nitrite antiporter [Thermus thermophilus HB8]QMV32167.1 putative nitrate transporter NarT [Thermus thermophilus]VCU54744.1 Probable nitrate transporter NarT [Thermus thermophilus]BDG25170.1 nitrate transporter [Thermus thermophilus]BDG27545.1 nitrate transporter [Thermus thermophilus]
MIHDPAQLEKERPDRLRVLWLSTLAFTLMFAAWLMFGVLGVPIRKEFGLSDVQLSWISALAILNGSLWRLLAGILADRYGGRLVFTLMLFFTAIPAYLVSRAGSYEELLLYAFLVGFAGNSFSVGIAWNSAWFPKDQQGFALGVFGAGNVGASVTKFIGPALIASVPASGYLGGLIPGGWRFIPFLYAVLLVLMGFVLWFGTPRKDKRPGQGRPFLDMLKPLRYVRVWRFSLYYVVVFGAYVALSAWLPKYYVDVFGLPLHEAALLTALFIFPASLLRPVGGYLSDRFGARRIMYWTFGIILLASGVLMMPEGHIVLYTKQGAKEVMQFTMGVELFTLLVFLIGVGMGIGKAAVYKHIPTYFPQDVGAVGGLVGMLGALGGFFLPPLFAYAQAWTGLPQMTFFVLFLLAAISFLWMHLTVLKLLQQEAQHLKNDFELKGDRPC